MVNSFQKGKRMNDKKKKKEERRKREIRVRKLISIEYVHQSYT